MSWITRCTRSMTCAKSTVALADCTPYSLLRAICDSSLAERISALLGTQPVFRQSPPMRCFSISATFALVAAPM